MASVVAACVALAGCDTTSPPPPPATTLILSDPVRAFEPVASPKVLAWLDVELAALVHYGPPTHNRTGHGWETWPVVPDSINPSGWDPRQWARVARDAGIEGMVFTAKHHNGFALWPTATTDLNISRAPFKNGQGDMVADVAAAAAAEGLKFGVYLSPWDMNDPTFGTPEYAERYLEQGRELLTGYGPMYEMWFDAAHGPGASIDDVPVDDVARLAWELHPDLMAGPLGPPSDYRWGGNEEGVGEETNWSRRPGFLQPPQCNFPMRPNWFWTPSDDDRVMTPRDLVRTFFTTQGRGCQMMIGLAPDASGRITDADARTLRTFRAHLDAVFDADLAAFRPTTASSVRDGRIGWAGRQATDPRPGTFWAADGDGPATLEVDLGGDVVFDVVELREPLAYGQRVGEHHVHAFVNDEWREIVAATTVMHRRLHTIEPVRASRVRLTIDRALAPPVIERFAVYDSEGLVPDID